MKCSGTDIDFELQSRSADFVMQTMKMCCSHQIQTVYHGTSRGCVAKPVLWDVAVCTCAMCHDVGTQCMLIGSDEINPEEESDNSDVEYDDPSWEPMEEDTGTEDDDIVDDPELEFLSTSMVDTSPAERITERKFIGFESALKALMMVCNLCLSPCQHTSRTFGTFLQATIKCQMGHERKWQSQPLISRMPLGNILISSGIYFSGTSPAKVLRFLHSINIVAISKTTFSAVQSAYIIPAINTMWKTHQELALHQCQGEKLHLGRDVHCCTPGHYTKYGSYTMINLADGKVLDIQLVQSNEVKNSCAMEIEGLKWSFAFLSGKGIDVEDFTSDRHPQIRKYMRENKPGVTHWFDVWHVAKALNKKLSKAGNKSGFQILKRWSHSISNHRLLLAAVDHNENCNQKQRQCQNGELCWSVGYPKSKHGGHVLKAVEEECSYEYVSDLLQQVIINRLTFPSYKTQKERGRLTSTAKPLTSSLTKIGKEEAIANHHTRFNMNGP
nr:PREDICTED: uncharacterized protein LOC102345701 [Latimeria chalumnae]|eukprot:XP_006008217.1 PREDICTED: uncharacterized protein LOC102345701 [Latimeria chalumnae]